MKTLLIVRHAKSSWDYPGLDDLQRPLLEKGIKRTKKATEYLQVKNVIPDLIITSSAVRARETANLISQGLKIASDKTIEDQRLYFADAEHILDMLYDLPGDVDKVMIVGHNPALTNFVNRYLKDKIDVLPSSGIVALKLHTQDWVNAGACKISVDFVVYPKIPG
jgi:phosphohistidine phosphatase